MQRHKTHKLFTRLLLLVFLGSISTAIIAQQAVSGVVKDAGGTPLPGVNVVIKGTTIGTITDIDGKFSISPQSATDSLIISMVGYISEEVIVAGQTNINVTLNEDMVGLDEVIVVGYGTMKKKDITGAVASIGSDELLSSPIATVDQGMQGKMAGVTVQQTSGAPGQTMRMRIRGGGSINYSNEPLYVIDGFIGGDLTSISPQDIERIDVLKDASATAIYGSRGANGVVLVTTKTAKQGRFNITLDGTYGISKQVKPVEMLDAGTSAEYWNEIRSDLDQSPYFTDEEVEYFKQDGGTNYVNLMTRTAINQNYNLAMSGGTEKITYMISGGYLDSQGLIHQSFRKRYSLRSNVSAKIKPWLDLKFNTYGTHDKFMHTPYNETGGANQHFNHRAIMDAYQYPIFWPNKDENGNYIDNSTLPNYNGLLYPGRTPNPLQYNEYTANGENLNEAITSNLDLNFKITKNLEYMLSGAGKYRAYFDGLMPLADGIATREDNMTIRQRTRRERTLMTTNKLTYKNTFGLHNVAVSGIYEYSTTQGRRNDVRVNNLTTTGNDWYLLGNGEPFYAQSEYSDVLIQSYMARANYSYAEKYLLTATMRVDQTSVFKKENRTGYFPSAAVGWVVSEESFLSDAEWLSNLKIRAGYGETGNQAVWAYETKPRVQLPYGYGFPGYYSFDGVQDNIAEGVIPRTAIVSPDLKWETTVQTNVGLDLSLLEGKVNMTADYYQKQTKDVIFAKSVAAYTGKVSVTDNFGQINNTGFEFMVDWRAIYSGDFILSINGNVSVNRNKVVDLNGAEEVFLDENLTAIGMYGYDDNNVFIVKKGQPLGLFYGLKSVGLWSEEEAYLAATYNSFPGEHRYEDINNDGEINADDRQVIGQSQPDFAYGININMTYRNWNLTIGGFGMFGNEIYNYNRHYMDRAILNPDYKERWTTENQGATQQRLPIGAQAADSYVVSQYVEDGTFFKINNLTLSYNVPQGWLEKINMNSFSVFGSVNNLLTITKYSGVDPENTSTSVRSDSMAGLDAFSYPLARTYTFGFKTNF